MRDSPNRTALHAAAIVWIITWFIARLWIQRLAFGSPVVWVATALPVLPFVAFLLLLMRSIGSSDELERRIHLEALAVAFPLAMLLIMVLGLLETGIALDRQDWSYRHVWAFFPVLYLLGVMVARRRYGQ
jgi:uncharacterized membrane protein